MVTGRLEEWIPDSGYGVIWGHVYDDKKQRFPNGQWIHTSSVEGDMTSFKEGDTIVTRNSVYLLGKKAKIEFPKRMDTV